jgi:hypothetical protein
MRADTDHRPTITVDAAAAPGDGGPLGELLLALLCQAEAAAPGGGEGGA